MKLLFTSFLCLSIPGIIFSGENSASSSTTAGGGHEWLYPVGIQKNANIPESFRKIQQTYDIHPIQRDILPVNEERDLPYRSNCDISYVNEEDAFFYMDSGLETDTFAVVFQPRAPCVVEEVYVQWFTAGTVLAFGADYGSASEISPTGNCYDIPRGGTNLSPIGQLRTTPTLNTIDGYVSEWSPAARLDIGGSFVVSNPDDITNPPPFVIAFIKQSELPLPMSNYNAITGRTENYTWFGGTWTAGPEGFWGHYNAQAELMMMVKVQYPSLILPSVELGQLSDTFNPTGTRTVSAQIHGFNENVCTGDTTFLYLNVKVNNVIQYSVPLEDAVPVEVDGFGNGVYDFTFEYDASVGDIVYYWAVSDEMFQYISPDYEFQILQPDSPDAHLLIIMNSEDDNYLDGFELAANLDGYDFESWDIHQRNGIDASVINWGWPNILIVGSGGAVLPVVGDNSDPGFGPFLQTGGNLMLVDQDWFDQHQLESFPEELTFASGDPAFDWFGIQGAVSNPDDDGDMSNGGTGDTFVVSQLDELPDLELNHNIYGTTNRADYLIPADAEPLYRGDLSDEVTGVRYVDGISKRAFFSFMADAAVDSLQDGSVFYTQAFFDFFSAMMDWFQIQLGDLTGDSAVDVLDIVLMVGFIMGDFALNPEQTQSADMNNDGVIDVQDVVLMVYVILGGE